MTFDRWFSYLSALYNSSSPSLTQSESTSDCQSSLTYEGRRSLLQTEVLIGKCY